MSHPHSHALRAISEAPSWSLLRLSAATRFGLALVVIAAVWAATLAMIL